jgi:hypothetical protein
MINLKFKPFLPQEVKPKSFENFRQIASDIYKGLEGNLTFMFLEGLNQFEIEENTTNKNNVEIKNMLGEYSTYLN